MIRFIAKIKVNCIIIPCIFWCSTYKQAGQYARNLASAHKGKLLSYDEA